VRITTNKEAGRLCDRCKQPLVLGQPGANYAPVVGMIRRGHPQCVRAWLKEARGDVPER
jgi:hypothetical protein